MEKRDFSPLTDAEWQKVAPFFPTPVKRGRGKPHSPWRTVVNTVLYIHLTKTKWACVPRGSEWASKSAAHRWMKEWEKSGLLGQILSALEQEEVDFSPMPDFPAQERELLTGTSNR